MKTNISQVKEKIILICLELSGFSDEKLSESKIKQKKNEAKNRLCELAKYYQFAPTKHATNMKLNEALFDFLKNESGIINTINNLYSVLSKL